VNTLQAPQAPQAPVRDDWLAVTEIRFGLANAALVAALFLAAFLRLGPHPTLALLAIVVWLAARWERPAYGVALGVVGWACFTGFAVNDLGILTFNEADLLRLLALAAVGLLASTLRGLGSAWRSTWRWRACRAAP
jgi:hypothetical protein